MVLRHLAMHTASAPHLGSGADHFAKVAGLISDMIERLEDEAEANATEKAFCYEELSEINTKKTEKAQRLGAY